MKHTKVYDGYLAILEPYILTFPFEASVFTVENSSAIILYAIPYIADPIEWDFSYLNPLTPTVKYGDFNK